MSAADLELVRGSIDVWSNADYDGMRDFFAEDVVFHSATMDTVGKTVVGLEAMRKLAVATRDDWAEIRWEVDEVFEAEHGIVTFHRVIAKGHASGIELSDARFGLYDVRDGRIARAWIYTDRNEVLEAAGPRK